MTDIILKRWTVTVLEQRLPFSVLCIWAPDEAEALAKVREHFPEQTHPGRNVTVDPYLVNGKQPTQKWPYGYRRRLATERAGERLEPEIDWYADRPRRGRPPKALRALRKAIST